MTDKRIWWRRVGLGIGVVLMLFVLARAAQALHQLPLHSAGARWPALVAACTVALAAQFAFATAWHLVVADGAAPRRWRHDLARWSVSLGGKYLPGKVFHGALRVGAYRGSAAGGRVAASFLRESLLSVGAACAWVALHAALAPASAPPGLAWPMLACAIAATLAAVLPPPARLPAWFARWQALRGAALAAPRGAHVLAAWALQATGYLAYGCAVWLIAMAFGVDRVPDLLSATGAFCFAGVAGIAAFMVPAGLGVREAAMAWYLAAWMPPGTAALVAIAARLCLSLAEAITIGIGVLLVRAERA
jgi:hypothetical protein